MLSTLPEATLEIIRKVEERVGFLDNDNLILPVGEGVHVGGPGQLEALALYAQLVATQEAFGLERSQELSRRYPRRVFTAPQARSLEAFFEVAGYPLRVEGRAALDVRFAFSALIASLMCRRKNVPDADSLPDEEVRLFSPSGRLYALLTYLKSKGVNGTPPEPLEAWHHVSAGCKELWGREPSEEMDADIAMEEVFAAEIASASHVPEVVKTTFDDWIRLRRRIHRTLVDAPELLVEPQLYARETIYKTRPSVVFCHRGSAPPIDGATALFSFEDPLFGTRSFACMRHSEAPSDAFTLRRHRDWEALARDIVPLSRAYMTGRLACSLLYVDVAAAEEGLRRSELEPLFEPSYAHPEIDRDPTSYFEWMGAEELVCDATNVPITSGTSFLASAWDFVRHERLREDARTAATAAVAIEGLKGRLERTLSPSLRTSDTDPRSGCGLT